MPYNISGTVYTDQGATPMGAGRTVAVSINGAAAATTTTTDANGNFTLSGLTTGSSGQPVVVYLQGNTEVGVAIMSNPTNTSTNITGVVIYENYLAFQFPTGAASASMASPPIYTSDNNGASGLSAIYSAASPNLTLAAGKSLYIASGFNPNFSGINVSVGGSFKSDSANNIGAASLTFTGSGTINVLTNISGGITIADGASITADSNITLTTLSFTVNSNGSFNLNGKTLTIPGNFSNSGTFTHGSGSVTFTGTSSNTISGSTTFYNLTKTVTSNARSITFADGTTQTVENSLTLQGISGNLLTLQGSGSAGWTIAVPATQTLSYLSVSRSTATGNTAAAGSTSTDGGNNVNWTFGAQASIPSKTTLVHGLGL